MSKQRTITLTDRPPVTIAEDNWPLIAVAKDYEHDGQVECQANRKSSWWIGVRKHDDGRAIVYATYSYSTNWQNARDYAAKQGVLLPAASTTESIVDAIKSVGADIAGCECDGNDSERWDTLIDECIADMPAESLDGETQTEADSVVIANAVAAIAARCDLPSVTAEKIKAVLASANRDDAAKLLTLMLEAVA